jgi:FlaA1/EpsC-like NDP-sugar epimerase
MTGRSSVEGQGLLTGTATLAPARGESPTRPWQRVVARRYGIRESTERRLLAVADVIGITFALALSHLVISVHPSAFFWGLTVLPIWIIVFKAYGLYDRDLKRICHQTVDDLPWIFHAVLVGCLLLLACYRFLPVDGVWLGPLAVFAVLAMASVAGLRALARRLAVSFLGPERVVLLGQGREISTLAKKLEANEIEEQR